MELKPLTNRKFICAIIAVIEQIDDLLVKELQNITTNICRQHV